MFDYLAYLYGRPQYKVRIVEASRSLPFVTFNGDGFSVVQDLEKTVLGGSKPYHAIVDDQDLQTLIDQSWVSFGSTQSRGRDTRVAYMTLTKLGVEEAQRRESL